jgi:translocator protein
MNLAHAAVELLAAMVRIDSANPGLAGNGPGLHRKRPESRRCSTDPLGMEPTPTPNGSASTPPGPARACFSPSPRASAPSSAARCERESSGKVQLMAEISTRGSRRAGRLRQVGAWTGAAVVYGAAQGLSAWVAQHARGRGTRPQYEQFERPAFAPPGAVFPVVWSALNVTTATSAWRVWDAAEAGPETPSRRTVLGWWAAAVIVRSGYVPLAFGSHRLWAATADSALLCAVMTYYASLARQVDRGAAALAVPEVAWTAFATVLSAAVAVKNKP